LEAELAVAFNIDEQIANAQRDAEASLKNCTTIAKQLHKQWAKTSEQLQVKVNKLLPQVGMPNAHFVINCTEATLGMHGATAIEFLLDANNTGQAQAINKVASGGELSRVLLVIKSLLAGNMQLNTLIFDEVDTGISGEVAVQVAKLMQALSAKHQVIAITHLPQVAAKAQQHLYLYKQANKQQVLQSSIKVLTQQERIIELATMLAGNQPSQSALATAQKLMMQ
jgi:DNA repair protein RecN (Recombination protein N)